MVLTVGFALAGAGGAASALLWEHGVSYISLVVIVVVLFAAPSVGARFGWWSRQDAAPAAGVGGVVFLVGLPLLQASGWYIDPKYETWASLLAGAVLGLLFPRLRRPPALTGLHLVPRLIALNLSFVLLFSLFVGAVLVGIWYSPAHNLAAGVGGLLFGQFSEVLQHWQRRLE